ncbi:gliding motility-associated C-terminal domain-containing protein [uncultured Aquimarina sp.]|uniref:T9SS type B sorting domain-containing protein n=1 Tax=uncultured Aquimarina sp. TaxID=575652 RepID=UPI002638E01B|nr:gliding motility-associated C-terminal domain-containing protein [uncultured Aquimarina sp.]
MQKLLLVVTSLIFLISCNSDDNDNSLSCCGEDSLVVETNNLSGDTQINIFNVITPNGDGVNDAFIIAGLAAYPNNSIKVFSNNTLVFETNNYHQNQVFGIDLVNDSFTQKVFTYELIIDNGDSFKARGTICAVKSSGGDIDSCNAFDLGDPLFD